MSRLEDLYARISPHLAHRPGAGAAARAQARLARATRGRIGGKLLGIEVLVLRSTGRKSGKTRESPAFFIEHPRGWAVCASNAASERMPAWLLNLDANPAAEVILRGRTHPVRARRATPEEAEALWPEFVARYRGYEHYRSIAKRELPVVILERA